MKEVILACGTRTQVSDEDFDFLSQWAWHRFGHYAGRLVTVDGKRVAVLMHRVVAERAGLNILGLEVDHDDRNKLNNQRHNLKPATKSQNQHNAGPRKDSTSGLRGVSFFPPNQWRARIQVRGTRMSLGLFNSLDEAKAARDAAEERFLGRTT